jgi:hypothetical protein
MAVVYYQLFIIFTLVIVRVAFPKRLLLTSLIWSGFTAINLFYPPLIIIQLIVIWTAFAMLGPRREAAAPAKARPKPGGVAATREPPRSEPPVKQPPVSGFSRGLSEFAEFADTQHTIQNALSPFKLAFCAERARIEGALKAAKVMSETDRWLRTMTPERRARNEELKARLERAWDEAGEGENNNRDKLPEITCADFTARPRNGGSTVANAVEAQLDLLLAEYSKLLSSVTKDLNGDADLRATFEERMREAGAADLLKRISAFEANREWRTGLADAPAAPQSAAPALTTATAPSNGRPSAAGAAPAAPVRPGYTKLVMRDASLLATAPEAGMAYAGAQPAAPSLPLLDRLQIQKQAADLQIPYVLHFTRAANLHSIMTHGLLPREAARGQGVTPRINDQHRWDGRTDATSISIGFPNARMFWKYREEEAGEDWAVLIMSPAILWTKNCAFCKHNAADKRIRKLPLSDLMSMSAFAGLFAPIEGAPSREMQGLKPFDPTDVQAEVLVFGVIEPSDITAVVFENSEVLAAYSDRLHGRDAQVHPAGRSFFDPRIAVRKAGS